MMDLFDQQGPMDSLHEGSDPIFELYEGQARAFYQGPRTGGPQISPYSTKPSVANLNNPDDPNRAKALEKLRRQIQQKRERK